MVALMNFFFFWTKIPRIRWARGSGSCSAPTGTTMDERKLDPISSILTHSHNWLETSDDRRRSNTAGKIAIIFNSRIELHKDDDEWMGDDWRCLMGDWRRTQSISYTSIDSLVVYFPQIIQAILISCKNILASSIHTHSLNSFMSG